MSKYTQIWTKWTLLWFVRAPDLGSTAVVDDIDGIYIAVEILATEAV